MTRAIRLGAAAALTALGLGAPGLAHAAGFQNMSQSATANGMGSVGTANPDEPNASFYNPANLAMRDGFEVYVGDTILIPSTSWTSLDGEETVNTVSQVFPPPNFHLGMPIDLGEAGRVGLGLGVTLPYGLGIAWPEGWEGRDAIVSQDLQTYNINPNVAYKIPGLDLSLAAGAQIYRSNVRLVRDIVLRDDVAVTSTIAGSGWGFGATASAMYKPIESLSIGLNYRGAVDIDIDGQARFEGEEDTPFEGSFVDQGGATTIPIPHAFTLGVGWAYKKLFVGVDVNYTTWSRYDEIVLEFERPCEAGSQTCDPEVDTSDPPTTTITSNWEDAMAFRLGLEYEIIDDLKVRAGGVYDRTPIPEQTLSPSLPGNDRAAFSLGAGYTIAGVRADVSWQFVNALEREVVDNDNLPGTYKTTAHVIGLNLGYGY